MAGGPGADLRVVRDDGSNWRDIPPPRGHPAGTKRVQGHQQRRGRMNSVLSAMSAKSGNRIIEGFQIPAGNETSHLGAGISGGKYVGITRGLERAASIRGPNGAPPIWSSGP